MTKKLERFVKDNRKAFDSESVPAGLWDKIDQALDAQAKPEKNTKYLWRYINIAAVLGICITVGIFIYQRQQPVNVELADISPSSAAKEMRFIHQIEEKKDSLEIFKSSDPELYKKFVEDLKNLDIEYEKLKGMLPGSPNKQAVVKAMVKNRELQVQLLKQQLYIFNEVDYTLKKVNSI